jgi:hypothetical protein
MSYFIFLKYLKSLEEFRKNPCVQIPHKSPWANFQSLGKFKNLIFNPKILLPIHFSLSAWLALPAHLAFGPASPTSLPSPAGRSLPRRPIWSCVDGVSAEIHFPFWFVPSELVAFSLVSLCQVDPGCQLRLRPRTSWPRLHHHRIPSRRATLRRPASHHEWLPHALTCPAIKTPSLTLPLTSLS